MPAPPGNPNALPPPGLLIGTLEKYAAPGRAQVPVLFKGPQGTSKTYTSRRFGREAGFDRFIEVGGHRGLESFDLLGQLVLHHSTTLWKDGPLTEAWRFVGCGHEEDLPAALDRGRTVFLLIDEVYRIPAREREIFLNSLQPEILHGIPCYKLRTGRPLHDGDSGVSREEILHAPVCLLSIVATTNVGLEFDVDEDDPAGRERWLSRYVRFDDEGFLLVVREELAAWGFRLDLAWKFLDLYRALENARRDGHLRCGLSLRTAGRIIRSARHEHDLPATCLEVLELCVDSDAGGEPLDQQHDILKTAIRRAGFGGPGRLDPEDRLHPTEALDGVEFDFGDEDRDDMPF